VLRFVNALGREVEMRNLLLMTASVIALGISGAGIAPAANMSDTSRPNPPAVAGMPRSSLTPADLANTISDKLSRNFEPRVSTMGRSMGLSMRKLRRQSINIKARMA
jgi:hypothetical protein